MVFRCEDKPDTLHPEGSFRTRSVRRLTLNGRNGGHPPTAVWNAGQTGTGRAERTRSLRLPRLSSILVTWIWASASVSLRGLKTLHAILFVQASLFSVHGTSENISVQLIQMCFECLPRCWWTVIYLCINGELVLRHIKVITCVRSEVVSVFMHITRNECDISDCKSAFIFFTVAVCGWFGLIIQLNWKRNCVHPGNQLFPFRWNNRLSTFKGSDWPLKSGKRRSWLFTLWKMWAAALDTWENVWNLQNNNTQKKAYWTAIKKKNP